MNFKFILCFNLFVFFLLPGIAPIYGADRGIENVITVAGDTISYKIDGEEFMNFNDSMLLIPGYEYYCQWDTLNIHSYRFDFSKKTDTTIILLNDPRYCGYQHPYAGEITSDFGFRKRRFHYGIDIKLETGDSVLAAFEGKVRIAKKSATYGNVIVIRHNNGLETLYAHLSKINVEVDQNIDAGECIGLGGNTGRSSGSHLHFEVRFMGQPINPNEIISFKDNNLMTDKLSLTNKNFSYLAEVKKNELKKNKFYTIKKGDTLSKIAKRHGTTTSVLCKLNKISKSRTLVVGKKIRFC